MRIRAFRYEDTAALLQLQDLAVQVDGIEPQHNFAAWLTDSVLDATTNAFVVTDDDDELNTWGQAGTLEGIEGEIVGYTLVQVRQNASGYHLLCEGTVHPAHRRRKAGRALLICALNRARVLAEEFDFEAEQAGIPVYFEALLPARDAASARLAARCEMLLVNETAPDNLRLYRSEL